MEISDEIQERLALLKSNFLSEIIIHGQKEDFDFTEYMNFDHQIEETLTRADEIWNYDGEVEVYRKFFGEGRDQFYSQIIITLKESSKNPLMIILSFVTRDESLAKRFCQGKREKISTHH